MSLDFDEGFCKDDDVRWKECVFGLMGKRIQKVW